MFRILPVDFSNDVLGTLAPQKVPNPYGAGYILDRCGVTCTSFISGRNRA